VAYAVYLILDNGTRDLASEFQQLGAAARYAFGLADEAALQPDEAHASRPRKVDVYDGERLEISIFVTRGGLLGNKGFPKLRSM
jgi:hypothetical protein